MQQQYANGMMPMMMPMMDPRLVPMMDPRLIPQPMMMMDPRLMSMPQMPLASTSNRSRFPQPQYSQGDDSSVGSNGRQKHKRHMSSSGSIATSINSATGSRYTPTARRTKNN